MNFADYFQKLELYNDTNQVPDIFQTYYQWGPTFVGKNMLAQAPTDVATDVTNNFVTAAPVTVNGKIWGIPTEIDDYILVYNKRIFAAAGITNPPTTWAELVADAVKTTKKDANGKFTQYGFAFSQGDYELEGDSFLSLFYGNGGQLVTPDKKTTLINGPEGLAVLEAEKQLFSQGTTDISGNFYDFAKGKIAMVIAPPWIRHNFQTGFGDKFNTEVGVASIPVFKKPTTLQYSWFTGVMAKSKHQQEAWDFLRWFTAQTQPATNTTRMGDLLANTIGAIPSRKSDIQNEQSLKEVFLGKFVADLTNSVASPSLFDYDTIRKDLIAELEAAWVGQKTPQQALDNAAKNINAILANYFK
jgi:multiple sugar transport system substrate-binding protein